MTCLTQTQRNTTREFHLLGHIQHFFANGAHCILLPLVRFPGSNAGSFQSCSRKGGTRVTTHSRTSQSVTRTQRQRLVSWIVRHGGARQEETKEMAGRSYDAGKQNCQRSRTFIHFPSTIPIVDATDDESLGPPPQPPCLNRIPRTH